MSISFTGLASGLPINDIITQLMAIERRPLDLLEKQQTNLKASVTYLDNIEARIKTLNTSILKFTDGNIASSMDLFKKKTATSSDTSKLTVTAGTKAVNQTFKLNILNIASSTKLQSNGGAPTGDVGNLVVGGTLVSDLANGTGKTGTFTVFYNGTGSQITVSDGETVQDVLNNITAATGGNITASIAGGQITLQSAGGTIQVGANGDTSNFLAATQLDIGTPVGNDIVSANSLSAIKTSGTLMGTANLQGAINAGTITVGGATFNIDATTTMDGLLQAINNSTEANVTASYNLRTNKLEFVSKTPGKTAITLDEGATNFFTATNLIAAGDTLAYQTLGNNAKFQVNGGPVIESTSNTVSDSVTGLKDITLNLLAGTEGSELTVTIKQNTDEIVSAISTFVTNFNSAIKYIDEMTDAKTGKLPSDPSLVRFRNNLRMAVTNMAANSPLYSLASVGITTGSIGSTGTASNQLTFDQTKFLDALNSSPDNVRALFIGDSGATPPITGIMESIKTLTASSLDSVNGFFVTRDEAITRQLADLAKSITRAQERLDAKETLLKKQFSAMESAISKLNSQSSYLTSQTSSTS